MKITNRIVIDKIVGGYILTILFCVFSSVLRGQIITTVAGTGVNGYSGDGGQATKAKLTLIMGVVTDTFGNIYISDKVENVVRKINPAGIITTIAGTGMGGYNGDNIPATAATLAGPGGMVIDHAGNLYVLDEGNARIRKVSLSGMITTIAGGGVSNADGVPATAAAIGISGGLIIDRNDNIYWSESFKIRKMNTAGIVSTTAGSGVSGYSGDGGPATSATFNSVMGLTIDTIGNIYLVDRNNYCVRKINSTGDIVTIAGNGTMGYSGNGIPATAATLESPLFITVDNLGFVYFNDGHAGSTVRVITPSGIIRDYAGRMPPGGIGDGGPATDASLMGAYGLAVDTAGALYIGCLASVRKVFNNHVPNFVTGTTGTISMCQDVGAIAINALLQVQDTDQQQNLIWSTYQPPAYGTAIVTYTALTTGSTITPTGLSYTPTAGYNGNDSFKVRITDGYGADSITIYVTVNPAAPVMGTNAICTGQTTTLSNLVTGGVWSSASTTVSVGTASGIVTGLRAGTTTITYTTTAGCTTITSVTVNTSVASIAGGGALCKGATTLLTDATNGGVWSSDNTTVATVGSTGIVNGVDVGTSTISYTLVTGCNSTKIISVNVAPANITGMGNVCPGFLISLSDVVSGGTWASSNTANATIDGSGIVSGIATGTATISYSLGTGCTVTKAMSVYAAPMAITGAGSVCKGAMTQLTDATAGGSWSATGSAASVGAGTGIVAGVSAGTTTISYVMTSTGCAATTIVTVSNAPGAIAGNSTVCTANTITLTNAVSGGTWSSTGSAASVGTTNGIVTGVSAGTATITYSLGGSCITTKIITVAPPLPAITGAATVCAGATTALSNSTSGGAWSATGAVNVGAGSGIVSGIAAGTGTATYTVATTGCTTTKTITVDPLPGPIMGAGSVCAGAMITLSDAGGGHWSAIVPGAVSVGTSTGAVTGVSPGTATVTYTLPVTGCKTTTVVQVYPVPSAIAGAGSVCAGAVVQLSDASVGGNWSAIVPGAVSVGTSTGVVTGMSAGTSTITYMTGPSCIATTIVTVNPNPAPITGAGSACAGDGVWLYDADGGGSWSATGGGVTILSTGYATTTIAGTSTIDYTFTTGCSVSKTLTIYAKPDPITGAQGICKDDITAMSDATPGGIWSATGGAVSVGAGSGIVTGMSAGTATIVYTLLGTGCTAVRTFTVYPLPTAITGATAVCMGSTGPLSNGISGGTWGPALDTIMNLDAITGDITGIKYGETIVTYTTANGCSATTTVTVHVVPNIYSMMGGGGYCAGDTGVHVLVAGSIIGTKYDLYNGTTLVDTKMGTNKTLDFGLVTTPGTYTAIATQTITTCQSKMDTSATVVVNPLMPTAVGITPTPSNIVCAGTPVLYTAVPVNGGAMPFYEWKVNGVSYGTGGTTYGYTPLKGDIVSLKMTSSVVCPSPMVIYGFLPMTVVDSIPPIVTITADPGVHVATGQPVTLTATVTNGITGLSYQWSVNGAAIAGATDNTYTESNPADHEVVSCAVMSNATCMTSDEESVELSIGAEGIAYPSSPSAPKGGLSVYPSPAKGSITVESSLNNASVSIYNVVGERVWVRLTMTKNKETIDVSKFLPGVYLLQAVDGSTGLTMTKRFVKE